jgi:hypothetical protein
MAYTTFQFNIVSCLICLHKQIKRLFQNKSIISNCLIKVYPVRTGVIIDPPHPFVCRKRRLNGGGPSEETGKTEVPCHSRCVTIKIPPCSKALSAEHRPKFSSPSPAMVRYPYKWKSLERDVKPYIIHQSINKL